VPITFRRGETINGLLVYGQGPGRARGTIVLEGYPYTAMPVGDVFLDRGFNVFVYHQPFASGKIGFGYFEKYDLETVVRAVRQKDAQGTSPLPPSVVARETSSAATGHQHRQHPPGLHRPPYDSTPILIRRIRRKRQRLRSNGSIESDPARQRQPSRRALARRVTPDRVLPFMAGSSRHQRRHKPPRMKSYWVRGRCMASLDTGQQQ
jgi:hypothetical protein